MRLMEFLGFWVLFILTACSPAKKLPVKDVTYDKGQILSALTQHNYPYSWFHGKGDVKIDGFDQSHHVQSVIRMHADSAIWMVFKKFEIEAIRFLMTPETYTVLFRLENSYMQGSTASIRNQLGVDVPYKELQDWLFGNVYLPDPELAELSQDQIHAEIRFQDKGWEIAYLLDKRDLSLVHATLKDAKGSVISMKFSDYKRLPSGETVAFYREINMVSPQGERAEMRMDFSEIEVNVPKELKFVVPSHYSEFE